VSEWQMRLGWWPLGRGLGFYLFQLNGWAQRPPFFHQILKIEIIYAYRLYVDHA
jgi:hypothetical protein